MPVLVSLASPEGVQDLSGALQREEQRTGVHLADREQGELDGGDHGVTAPTPT